MVIPDILALASPGERAECHREASQRKNPAGGQEGVRGLRALGVRDLSYRLAFIASSVQVGCLVTLLVTRFESLFLAVSSSNTCALLCSDM